MKSRRVVASVSAAVLPLPVPVTQAGIYEPLHFFPYSAILLWGYVGMWGRSLEHKPCRWQSSAFEFFGTVKKENERMGCSRPHLFRSGVRCSCRPSRVLSKQPVQNYSGYIQRYCVPQPWLV